MKKRFFVALAVPLWIAAPSNAEGPAVTGAASEACRTIAAIVRIYPALEVRKIADPVPGAQNGSGSFAGCRVLASGPASTVAGEVLPEDAVRELLQQGGWKEDPDYSADGPGTSSFGLRRGGTLCLVTAGAPSGVEDGKIFTDDTYRFEARCAAE